MVMNFGPRILESMGIIAGYCMVFQMCIFVLLLFYCFIIKFIVQFWHLPSNMQNVYYVYYIVYISSH